jgi:exodeoxyribonuclease VII small subunit
VPDLPASPQTAVPRADGRPGAGPEAREGGREGGRYEELVARLSQVVERIEAGGLSLEDSIAAFEEGVKLVRASTARLDEAERQVELLLDDDRTQPFASGEAEPATRRRPGGA